MSTFAKLAAAALGLMLAISAGAGEIRDQVDWPKFLSRHDLVYGRLPAKWGEGAFTGNGLVGAMVYLSDDGQALRFRLNRSDVMMNHQACRIPIGDLVLLPAGTIQGGSMRLDLWNAEVRGTIKTDKGEIAFRTFTHAQEPVQVIEVTPSDGEQGCRWDWRAGPAVNPRTLRNKEPVPEAEQNPEPEITRGEMNTLLQRFKTGGEYAVAGTVVREGPTQVLYTSIGYKEEGTGAVEQATEAVEKARSEGVSRLEETHRGWWHAFYPASFLSVPDTRLESFYWIQMYKLASATRADRPAIDLMGPWFNETPWPRIWWNLNIQLTYYPVYSANHLELGESLCRMIDAGAKNLAANAGEFSADSETIARTSGYDCKGKGGAELCNYPWALHNYYMQYRYSMDDAMLRERLLPRLKGAMNFYLHNLKEGPDGKLHTVRGMSPEFDKKGDHTDCNIDLGLIRWGMQAMLDSCARLKIEDPQIPVWKETLAKLADYPADENGLRISADQPFDKSHRHYSHLLMVFPLYTMNWDQNENRDLIRKSLEHWMSMPEALRGYSYTGAASMYAEMGQGDEALKELRFFVDAKGKYGCLPNTMYLEAGPVIETPLSAARSLQDMLLQSWGGTVRVFPAVPAEWKDVTIRDMRAEGAFLVSAVRKGGKTQWVSIKSLAGEPLRVKTGMGEVEGDREVRAAGEGVVEVKLGKGETVTLWEKGERPGETVVEAVAAGGEINSFGVR